jgi:pimeloyl-ACP methyl ester carboxylesterase
VVEYSADPETKRVVIYGSNDLGDWLRNFGTGRTIGNRERVNRWDRYEALVVLRGIRDLGIHVQVIGHSRGGAIAQIVARELMRQHRLSMCTVYGSKRTGNRTFVDALTYGEGWFSHIRNRGDWIPLLPPWYARLPEWVTAKPWRPVWLSHLDYPYS